MKCKNNHDLKKEGVITSRGAKACRACDREYKRKWALQTSKKDARVTNAMYSKLINRYGITYDEFLAFIKKQKGKCPICRKKINKKDTFNSVVDHNHKTGKVRGILHRLCNSGLGHFSDDIKLLKNALEYLNNA